MVVDQTLHEIDTPSPREQQAKDLVPPAQRMLESAFTAPSQPTWYRQGLRTRLLVLKRARHLLAGLAPEIAALLSPQLSRTQADTMVAELLPLLEAMRFLERNAAKLLAPRRLGRTGLPFWLSGIDAEVHHVPFARVLVIAPSNYPLFLPGVQAAQALAAGCAVVWKPGAGGGPVAHFVAKILCKAGLPSDLLQVTDDTAEAAQQVIGSGVDKVFFTGSARTGKLLLGQLAETATPCVVELAGNDAVVVLPSADLDRVVQALAFGMRLNGSATCMAPRRILLVDATPARRALFLDQLTRALAHMEAVPLAPLVEQQLARLIASAQREGAVLQGALDAGSTRPLLVLNGTPHMEIAKADLFAPVLILMDVRGVAGVLEAQAACPFALTTSIFGDEQEARRLALDVLSGTVTINDLIVPTADPRVPFGGRKASGFGVTRGAEGLLEMTSIKVISTRRNRSVRHFEPTGEQHAALFRNIITAAHGGTLLQRWSGLKRALPAAMELKKK